jgi:hypothetical protein
MTLALLQPLGIRRVLLVTSALHMGKRSINHPLALGDVS